MRLCVPLPCFFSVKTTEEFCNAVYEVKRLGFDAVEFYMWKNYDLKAIKKVLDETGVELISMCTSEFRLTSPEHSELWLEGLKESCEAANIIGAKKLITQVGNDTGAPREAQHAAIVETMIKGAPILEAAGITLMPEPLNVLVDHKGYYLVSSAEGFDIVREVGSPNVKLIYDIYHQQVSEGNVIPTIVNNLDLIAHLHGAGHPGRNDLQLGETDYRNVILAVDKAGYNGCLGLEYRPVGDRIESLVMAKALYGDI